MHSKVNIKALIPIVLILLGSGLIMNACQAEPTPLPDLTMNEQPDAGMNENVPNDNLQSDPKVGDITNDVINAITKARAYEEMQEVSNNPDFPYNNLLSRVYVEYKGKKTKMQGDNAAILEFSPNGKYLLYIARTAWKNESGTYLYNIESGKTQELIPSVPRSDPRFIPYPQPKYMSYEGPKWENDAITYQDEGKTWTLKYKEE